MPNSLRKEALCIAAQLPSDAGKAMEVLRLAQEIVDKFFLKKPGYSAGPSSVSKMPNLRAVSGSDAAPS